FLDATAEGVTVTGKGQNRCFYTETTGGKVASRSLILATGVGDRFPKFAGSEECIGRSMFWCIICDGYETIDKKIVVLGHGNRAASLALEMLVFTPHVTLVSWDQNFSIDAGKLETLKSKNVTVYDSSCSIYQCTKGQLSRIELEDGTQIELDMLFVAQTIEPKNQLAKQLNIKVDEHGFIVTDSEQITNIEGVFAAGDVTRLHNHQVTTAVHEGGMAAAAANYYLYEEWQKE
ncbi:MAG TPA: NAD(P)/FAD-dependent oxidoreductase, partial [Chloroflexia bacterium]|nr:NAD(P)/FAD-dependent oxidoreductase [Chloroflexia bacterium]